MDTSSDESVEHIPTYGIPIRPQDSREPHERQRAVYLILASTLFERLAFYTLASNIALNLKASTDISVTTALLGSFLFTGISNFSSIIFAIISDARFGRGKTILFGFSLYLIGYASAVGFTCLTNPNCTDIVSNHTNDGNSSEFRACWGWLLSTLVLISIGSGAVQANMSVFGGEQIQKSTRTSRYFDFYLLVVNIGGIFGTVIIRLTYQRSIVLNQYFIPSVIAASSILLSTVLFVIGWKYYIHDNLRETVVQNCISVIINAFQGRHRYEKESSQIKNKTGSSEPSTTLNASQSIEASYKSLEEHHRPSTFLDFAKVPYGKFHDRIVNDVKSLHGVIIVFTLLIPYWMIINQLSSIFPLQALHMSNATESNVVYMWLGDPATIIIGILLMNLFLYKYVDVSHRTSVMVNKFIIGMFFAFLTAIIAGTVEFERQKHWRKGENSSDVHFCYTLPQNILLGISEIFLMKGSYEYSYYASPRSGLSLFMSLRFCSVGISSFIAVGYLNAFGTASGLANNTLDFTIPPENNEQWPFYTYFFILAGLQLIFIFIFILCQKKYQILKLNPQQTHRN